MFGMILSLTHLRNECRKSFNSGAISGGGCVLVVLFVLVFVLKDRRKAGAIGNGSSGDGALTRVLLVVVIVVRDRKLVVIGR